MPEQLTKHPEITLQVLRSAGAKCAEGAPQDILSRCPAERFCKLPGGEVCVYGLPEAPTMTQISVPEWRALVQSLSAEPMAPSLSGGVPVLLGAGGGLLAGAVIGVALSRYRHKRHDDARRPGA